MSATMVDMGILRTFKKGEYEKFASLVQVCMQYCGD